MRAQHDRDCLDDRMKRPVQDRSRDSTNEMLSAAYQLLAEGGLSAVTVAAVSARSGHSNGALYFRFKSRTGLLAATQARFLDRMESEVEASIQRAQTEPDDSVATRILIDSFVAIFTDHRSAFRALMVEGQGIDVLRERGRRTSYEVQSRVVDWMTERLATTRAAAEMAVYVVVSAAVAGVIFTDDLLVREPGPERLGDALERAVFSLVRQ